VLKRLTGALVVALALGFAGAAAAAEPLSRSAQRVYDDYRLDGEIEPCDHTAAAYRKTLEEITPEIEEETPAFRPAVEAAEQAREDGKKCKGAPASDEEDKSAPKTDAPAASGSSPGSTGGGSPAQPTSPGPAAPSGGSAPAPSGGDAPVQSDAPPATTPAPAAPVTAAPAPAAEETGPVLLSRPHEGTPLGLLIAVALLGLALLAVLAALALRRLGWGEERLAGVRHTWAEAGYRASGTWADFVDWVRLGR